MKTVIFKNPSKTIFFELKSIGLINFYNANEPETVKYKGIPLNKIETPYSKNACFGHSKDIHLGATSKAYKEKYMNETSTEWIQATIDLTDEGIEILRNSGIKGWEVEI